MLIDIKKIETDSLTICKQFIQIYVFLVKFYGMLSWILLMFHSITSTLIIFIRISIVLLLRDCKSTVYITFIVISAGGLMPYSSDKW